MADEEDSFIREVNEELRRENARALWGRYGPILIGAAVALVLATAAWQGYNYWMNSKAARIGGTMVTALALGEKGQYDASQDLLDEVKASDFGAYPALAAFRGASLLIQKGEAQAALQAFDALADDDHAPDILRIMARLRAAYLLVDLGTLQDVEARVKMLATDNNAPVQLAAREALGLAAWKAQDYSQAKEHFEYIMGDGAALRSGFQARAAQLLELIAERLPAAADSSSQAAETE